MAQSNTVQTKSMHKSLKMNEAALAKYCKKHHMRGLALFGSQSSGTAGPESDIDLLVEFDEAHIPGLMGIAEMEIELTELLSQKVDLRTAVDLSRYFRDEVLQMAQVQYAA